MIKNRLNEFLSQTDTSPTKEFLDSLYEGFAALSLESLRMQRISRVMTGLAIVGVVIAFMIADWRAVSIIVLAYIIANLFDGWRRRKRMAKKLGWSLEKQRAALDLVTEPEWQRELKTGGNDHR